MDLNDGVGEVMYIVKVPITGTLSEIRHYMIISFNSL